MQAILVIQAHLMANYYCFDRKDINERRAKRRRMARSIVSLETRVAKFRPLSYDQSLKYRVLLRVSDKMWARRRQLP